MYFIIRSILYNCLQYHAPRRDSDALKEPLTSWPADLRNALAGFEADADVGSDSGYEAEPEYPRMVPLIRMGLYRSLPLLRILKS